MFDLFKQDIKIGDKVKLYLTTGKEPEGIVISIGDNFVLLQVSDNIQNRFLEKLIGGWDVIYSPKINEFKTLGYTSDSNLEKTEIDQSFLIEQINLFKSSLDRNTITKFIEPNANIIEVQGTTCVATNENNPKILILNNRLFDTKLIAALESFNEGSIIPVVLSIHKSKEKTVVTTAVIPAKLEDYLNTFLEFINVKDYGKANLVLSVIRNYVTRNVYLGKIIKEFQKVFNQFKNKEPKALQFPIAVNTDGKKFFKSVEREINDLIRQSKFDFALKQIDIELENNSIDAKYKSSLLLKKAQIYSSLNKPEESENAYSELVVFNEKIKSPSNNLSHLYTELARLQSLKPEKKEEAIKSVKRALEYNRNNNFADNLLKQLKGNIQKTKKEEKRTDTSSDEHLLIEANDDKTVISNMIDLDIKEHKYSHPEIIKNGGTPTTFIAELITKEARDSGGIKVTENYPLYLEAAKAFSELNVGSYELKDYLEAVAYYSMLKGNSLYGQFKYNLLNKEIDLQSLNRLNESACDYYIETLNIISNIDSKSLVVVLTNFLQLKVARHYLEINQQYDYNLLFDTKFTTLFNTCSYSKEDSVKWIAIKSIINIGSNSVSIWNKLNGIFQSEIKFTTIFKNQNTKTLINNRLNSNVDLNLSSRDFLIACFGYQRSLTKNYNSEINSIISFEFMPTNFRAIHEKWVSLFKYNSLLQKTDKETFQIVENIIQIIQPYLNRNDKERGNILYSVIKKIENQLEFINQNTTFYGRTFFYRLLKKWRSEVDELFEKKIAQSYPSLVLYVDPPYYVKTNGEFTAPLLIKNEGEATAEGFSMEITCEATEYTLKEIIHYESIDEIPVGSKHEIRFTIPPHIFIDSKAVEISIDIAAVYQKKKLNTVNFQFTLEDEPESILTYDDIPWKDSKVPPDYLFKGRKVLIADLAQHYLSVEKDKPYILYGLTRTGKSSILEYLRIYIEGDTFTSSGKEKTILPFAWDLSVAAIYKKSSDFWYYMLYQRIYEELLKYSVKYKFDMNSFKLNENVRPKDFKIILEFLQSKNIYPIIFVDEFSFFKTLIDDGILNSAFLHTLRQFSLDELASFIYAGTYDIKMLIRDKKYGITGQLVNAIEHQVNEISAESAEQLINVINDKLTFTHEAVEHIKLLSGNIPYFIQIICKFCGYYASENNRRYIGYPELEKVIRILIGQDPPNAKSLVKKMSENIFQNNQCSPADPKEVSVLISSITYFNKDNITPRGVGFDELQKLWADKNIHAFRPILAETINQLLEKKIIQQEEDEGIPVYKFSVDLFRRWWSYQNPDINLILTTITEKYE